MRFNDELSSERTIDQNRDNQTGGVVPDLRKKYIGSASIARIKEEKRRGKDEKSKRSHLCEDRLRRR